jgi:hypothetical protein
MHTVFRSVLLLTLSLLTFGCAQNFYNVPRDVYEKQVRTLGVAPIFVDGDSDIRHPEKEALVNLVRENNRKNEKELVAQLRETGTYFAVRLLEDDADQLFPTLLSRREKRDDAGVKYNKYFFKPEELKSLLAKNGVDAIMLVTVNGLTRPEKIYSSNLLSYLESDYNYLAVSAQIVDAQGNTLWEYPNFRQHSLSYPMLFALQYPDFDEAKANESNNVEVRFKTIPGIARAFAKMEATQGKGQVSVLYDNIFSDMASLQQPERNLFGGRKDEGKEQKGAGQK